LIALSVDVAETGDDTRVTELTKTATQKIATVIFRMAHPKWLT